MADRGALGRVLMDLVTKAVKQATSNRGRAGTGSSSSRKAATSDRRTGGGSGRTGGAGRIDMPTFGRPATGAGSASAPRGQTRPGQDARRGQMTTSEARPEIAYSPVRDDDADPGEVVWAWVPYEEDATQGKDRPLLVIGHIGDDVAALQLTSRARDDRHHHALGTGPWDPQGRPSWIKLDRLLRLDPDAIRREGAVLDEQRFRGVITAWERY